MKIINRITGRESKELTKTLVETQNLLNAKIEELETEKKTSSSAFERISILERANKVHYDNSNELKAEIKRIKQKLLDETILKNDALAEVKKATKAVEDANQMVFDFKQVLASKDADLNEMIDKVSRLEQQIKQLQSPKVPQTRLGKKLNSIKKDRH